MNIVVVDASAYVYATTSGEPAAKLVRERLTDAVCHVPNLLDAEVGNVLRRLEARGEIPPKVAQASLDSLEDVVDQRYPAMGPLKTMAWQLRGGISYYDGLYAALAVAIGAPLVTGDARLSRAPELPCEVELVGQS
jgi:predicted nucleic acid-binding protein